MKIVKSWLYDRLKRESSKHLGPNPQKSLKVPPKLKALFEKFFFFFWGGGLQKFVSMSCYFHDFDVNHVHI